MTGGLRPSGPVTVTLEPEEVEALMILVHNGLKKARAGEVAMREKFGEAYDPRSNRIGPKIRLLVRVQRKMRAAERGDSPGVDTASA